MMNSDYVPSVPRPRDNRGAVKKPAWKKCSFCDTLTMSHCRACGVLTCAICSLRDERARRCPTCVAKDAAKDEAA